MQVIKALQNLSTKSRSFRLAQFAISWQIIFETTILNEFKYNFDRFIIRTDIKTIVLDDIRVVEFFKDWNLTF